jgi:glycosyltransferase involved in cell wall biosynthesis
MISILISAYNEEKNIEACLTSVLNQTYKDLQVVIINDGSTDATQAIVEKIAEKDTRITLVNNENKGLTKSLNEGLTLCKGTYVARIDGDDVWHKEKLQTQFDIMEKENLVLTGTNFDYINQEGTQIKEAGDVPYTEHEDILSNFYKINPFNHSSIVFKRDALAKEGGYNERFRYSQDYDFVFRLANQGRVKLINQSLMSRRITDKIIGQKKRKEQVYYSLIIRWNIIKKQRIFTFSAFKVLIVDVLRIAIPEFIYKRLKKNENT